MPLPRGLSLEEQPHVPEIPVGLPSVLLEARPDIRAPEEALVAANADVGVAKPALFPQIALTGTGGVSMCRKAHNHLALSLSLSLSAVALTIAIADVLRAPRSQTISGAQIKAYSSGAKWCVVT